MTSSHELPATLAHARHAQMSQRRRWPIAHMGKLNCRGRETLSHRRLPIKCHNMKSVTCHWERAMSNAVPSAKRRNSEPPT